MSDDLDILMTMPDSPDDEDLGKIDRYLIQKKVGEGSFGAVFKAVDEVSGMVVAIKALPSILSSSQESMESVRSNFQLTSKLKHPNIASLNIIHKVEKVESEIAAQYHIAPGDYLVVMDFAEGTTLRNFSMQNSDRKLPIDDAIRIARDVANALDYAHREKVVHRDVKQENIIINLQTSEIKLLDFGLAKEISSTMSRLTNATGSNSGTRPYMAPEQWEGKRQTEMTDQYSLAVLLYELLNGEAPFWSVFNTDDLALQMNVVLSKSPEPVSSISKVRNQILFKAMAKNPEERFPDCSTFIDAFENEKLPKISRSKKPLLIGMGAVAALLITGGVVAAILSGNNDDPVIDNTKTVKGARNVRKNVEKETPKEEEVVLLQPVAEGSFKAEITQVISDDGMDGYELRANKGRMHGVRDVIKAEVRLANSDVVLGKGRVYFSEKDYDSCRIKVKLTGDGTDYSISDGNKQIFYVNFPYPADHFEPDYRAFDEFWKRGEFKKAKDAFELIGEKWYDSPEYKSRQQAFVSTAEFQTAFNDMLKDGNFSDLVAFDKKHRSNKGTGISRIAFDDVKAQISQVMKLHAESLSKENQNNLSGAIAGYKLILKKGSFADISEKIQSLELKLSKEASLLKELDTLFVEGVAGKNEFRKLELKLGSLPEYVRSRNQARLKKYSDIIDAYLKILNTFSQLNAEKLQELPGLQQLFVTLESHGGFLNNLVLLENSLNKNEQLKGQASIVSAARKAAIPNVEKKLKERLKRALEKKDSAALKTIFGEIDGVKPYLGTTFLGYVDKVRGNARYIEHLMILKAAMDEKDYITAGRKASAIRSIHGNQSYFDEDDIKEAEKIGKKYSSAAALLDKAEQLYKSRSYKQAIEGYNAFLDYVNKSGIELNTSKARAEIKNCEFNIKHGAMLDKLNALKGKLRVHRFGQDVSGYRKELKAIFESPQSVATPSVKALESEIEKQCDNIEAQYKRVTAAKEVFDKKMNDFEKALKEAKTISLIMGIDRQVTALYSDTRYKELRLIYKTETAAKRNSLQNLKTQMIARVAERNLEDKKTTFLKELPARLDKLVADYSGVKQGDLSGFNRVERDFKKLNSDHYSLFKQQFSSKVAGGKFKSKISKLTSVRQSAWKVANHVSGADYAP